MLNTHAAIGLAYDAPCVALVHDSEGNCTDSYAFESITEGMFLDPFQNPFLAPSVRGQSTTINFRAGFINTLLKVNGY
jgi:hypothetical protein